MTYEEATKAKKESPYDIGWIFTFLGFLACLTGVAFVLGLFVMVLGGVVWHAEKEVNDAIAKGPTVKK